MQLFTLKLTIDKKQSNIFNDLCKKIDLGSNKLGLIHDTSISYNLIMPAPFVLKLEKALTENNLNYTLTKEQLDTIETHILNIISQSVPRYSISNVEHIITQNFDYLYSINLHESKKEIEECLIELLKNSVLLTTENGLIYTNSKSDKGRESLLRMDKYLKSSQVLYNIRKYRKELEALLKKTQAQQYDLFYRVYHHSFKAYGFQIVTKNIYDILCKIQPNEASINPSYLSIYKDGIKKFSMAHNKAWFEHVNPQVLAYAHSKFYLEAMLRSLEEIPDNQEPPRYLPSAWASILYLYCIR